MRKVVMICAALAVAGVLAIPAFAKTKNVGVRDNFFTSKNFAVHKGDSVKWVWGGTAPHNVTVTSGPVKFHSSTKTKGAYAHKFNVKGRYTILCTIHAPGMKMIVRVQ